MKRKIFWKSTFLAPILVLTGLSTRADEAPQNSIRPFQFGISTSANLNWVNPTQGVIESNGSSLGYGVGIFGDVNLSKNNANYMLSIELVSSVVYNKIKLDDSETYTRPQSNNTYSNISYRYRTNFFEIPISLKLKTNEIGYYTWFAQVGVTPSFLYSTSADLEYEDSNGQSISKDKIRNNRKDFEEFQFDQFSHKIHFGRFGILMAVGGEYRFSGNTAVFASLRLNNGLTNIFNAKNESDLPSPRGNNNFVSLNVGVLF